jgi:hypothetical protein
MNLAGRPVRARRHSVASLEVIADDAQNSKNGTSAAEAAGYRGRNGGVETPPYKALGIGSHAMNEFAGSKAAATFVALGREGVAFVAGA